MIAETRRGRTQCVIIILSDYRYPLSSDVFVMRKHILQEIRITRSVLSRKIEAITCLAALTLPSTEVELSYLLTLKILKRNQIILKNAVVSTSQKTVGLNYEEQSVNAV